MSKAALDKHFGRYGACMFHPTRYSRHRLVDAIRDMYAAGESVAKIAREYDLTRAAVLAAIHSVPDDNRMTPKEIAESKADWDRAFPPEAMKDER